MKVLIKKCDHCGKEISSIYVKQLDYNFKQHYNKCKVRKDEKRN